MAEVTYHRQCLLKKGSMRQTSWIPDNIAKEGLVVKLKEEDGTWDEGWTVVNTFHRLPTKYVEERKRDYLKTRQASDA